jgi:hypothetical protein
VQRRVTVRAQGVRIGAGPQQPPDEHAISFVHRTRKGRRNVRRQRTLREQELDNLPLAVARGNGQGRFTFACDRLFRSVHSCMNGVRVVANECSNPVNVAHRAGQMDVDTRPRFRQHRGNLRLLDNPVHRRLIVESVSFSRVSACRQQHHCHARRTGEMKRRRAVRAPARHKGVIAAQHASDDVHAAKCGGREDVHLCAVIEQEPDEIASW